MADKGTIDVTPIVYIEIINGELNITCAFPFPHEIKSLLISAGGKIARYLDVPAECVVVGCKESSKAVN